MRKLILGSLSALLAGVGLAGAEGPGMLPAPRTATAAGGDAGAGVAPTPIMPGPTVLDGRLAPAGADGPLVPAGDCLTVDGGCGGPDVWFGGEYLLWWYKKNNFPALLTLGPQSSGGVPGAPGVRTIGGTQLDNDQHSGARFNVGGYFTEYKAFGIEGSFFILESKAYNFAAAANAANGSQFIGLPFFDLLGGREAVRVITAPNAVSGSILATTAGQCSGSSRLYGGEFNFLVNLCCDGHYRLDLLLGYRHLSLEDRFRIQDDTSGTAGTASVITDKFDTNSRFNGGQVGARAEYSFGRLGLQVVGKVAVGSTDETLDSAGLTTLFTQNGQLNQTIPAGFLAVPGNSGRLTCEHFAVVPELNARVSFQVLDCLSVFAGYTMLYWSDVARTGDNINRNVNLLEVPAFVGTVPGTAPRQVTIRTSDFWAHGVSAGVEFRY